MSGETTLSAVLYGFWGPRSFTWNFDLLRKGFDGLHSYAYVVVFVAEALPSTRTYLSCFGSPRRSRSWNESVDNRLRRVGRVKVTPVTLIPMQCGSGLTRLEKMVRYAKRIAILVQRCSRMLKSSVS